MDNQHHVSVVDAAREKLQTNKQTKNNNNK